MACVILLGIRPDNRFVCSEIDEFEYISSKFDVNIPHKWLKDRSNTDHLCVWNCIGMGPVRILFDSDNDCKLELIVISSGSVPVKPLPDKCNACKYGKLYKQEGIPPWSLCFVIYAFDNFGKILLWHDVADCKPSIANVINSFALHILLGNVPWKQLTTATNVCKFFKLNISFVNSPVNWLLLTCIIDKFFCIVELNIFFNVPVNSLSYINNDCKCWSVEIDEGNTFSKLFFCKYKNWRLDISPILLNIWPFNWFNDISNVVNNFKLLKLFGIVPVNWLLLKFKNCKLIKFPNVYGIVPVK